MKNTIKKIIIGSESLIILILSILLLFFITTSITLKKQNSDLLKDQDNLLKDQDNITYQLEEAEKELAYSVDEVEFLNNELDAEKERVDDLEKSFKKITNTVDDLEKLSKTDPELLQKYSKVFFLNEHYTPPILKDIDENYLYDEKELEIHKSVHKFLEDLLEEADDDGLDLLVKSSFRSFGTHTTLKNEYLITYGAGANSFSADQGYSEHQLGTTVDFTTSTTGSLTTSFELTEEFTWLEENAYKYGFILSYPKGNAYYQYEPWHWRFVGKDLARKLHRNDEYFYDMDQRDINEYLLEIFD